MPIYAHGPYSEKAQDLVKEIKVKYSLMIYRDLEEELDEFCRYVPAVKAHYSVFSTKLWGIILRACSEIDSQLFELVNEISPRKGNRKIVDYYNNENTFELAKFSLLTKFEPNTIVPFHSFSNLKAPSWWLDYNSVKHERLNSLESATLENAINAVGALYIVLLRQYGEYLFLRKLSLVCGQTIAESPSEFFSVVTTPW
jgi:hypothetical protein